MRNLLFKSFSPLGPRLRVLALRPWYEILSSLDRDGEVRFMNYGYQSPIGPIALSLHPEDEPDRYCIQLYNRLISNVDLKDRRILEVGCGRGGGTYFFARYFGPAQATGIDITHRAIRFCQNAYSLPHLDFRLGNAQALPFPDSSVDVVANLESSHCYPDVRKFFREVHRVLVPGGHFAFADWRSADAVQRVKTLLTETGFALEEEEDLTDGVLAAIELDEARKSHLIQKHSPALLRPIFEEFAGMQNSRAFYQAFRSGERTYFRLLLTRVGAAD
jgi:SAM-dependent methyltransferase